VCIELTFASCERIDRQGELAQGVVGVALVAARGGASVGAVTGEEGGVEGLAGGIVGEEGTSVEAEGEEGVEELREVELWSGHTSDIDRIICRGG
jgi:hypothetical protein